MTTAPPTALHRRDALLLIILIMTGQCDAVGRSRNEIEGYNADLNRVLNKADLQALVHDATAMPEDKLHLPRVLHQARCVPRLRTHRQRLLTTALKLDGTPGRGVVILDSTPFYSAYANENAHTLRNTRTLLLLLLGLRRPWGMTAAPKR